MVSAEKLHNAIGYLLQAAIFIGLVFSIIEKNYFNSFLLTAILFLTFLPAIFSKRYQIGIPSEFNIAIIIFIFASTFLGEIYGYYRVIWWWDIVLHGSSAFLLGIVGFLLVYVLNKQPKIPLHLKPGFIALFAFVFAFSIGALWEIIEFGIDLLTNYGMQHGLFDTMMDLVLDAGGALVVAVLGYLALKKRGKPVFAKAIHRFIKFNPRLFK